MRKMIIMGLMLAILAISAQAQSTVMGSVYRYDDPVNCGDFDNDELRVYLIKPDGWTEAITGVTNLGTFQFTNIPANTYTMFVYSTKIEHWVVIYPQVYLTLTIGSNEDLDLGALALCK